MRHMSTSFCTFCADRHSMQVACAATSAIANSRPETALCFLKRTVPSCAQVTTSTGCSQHPALVSCCARYTAHRYCAHGQKHVTHHHKSKWGSLKQTLSLASRSATGMRVLATHDLSMPHSMQPTCIRSYSTCHTIGESLPHNVIEQGKSTKLKSSLMQKIQPSQGHLPLMDGCIYHSGLNWGADLGNLYLARNYWAQSNTIRLANTVGYARLVTQEVR